MSDTLAGLTRRIKTFTFDRDTAGAIALMVEETAEYGADAADAIVELGLPDPRLREDAPALSWSYGSAAPDGSPVSVDTDAPAFVLADMEDDGDPYDGTWTDPEEDDDGYDPETDEEEAEGEDEEEDAGDLSESLDEDELGAELSSLEALIEDGLGSNELAEASFLRAGEAMVY